MSWFARFWWHDTVDEMQRKMLIRVNELRHLTPFQRACKRLDERFMRAIFGPYWGDA